MQDGRAGADTKTFGRSAGLLSAGIGVAGLLTYVFFSLASHNLDATAYGEIVVLWSAVFVTISIAHRPVEQLLSRTIAERHARGQEIGSTLRTAFAIQLTVSVLLGALALGLREPLQDELLGGSAALYWVLVVAVVFFGASFYARGYFAGNRHFGLLAVLLLCESGSRMAFALAVAVGVAEGQTAVALGVAAAPIVSILAVPLLLLRSAGREDSEPEPEDAAPVGLAAGGGFAAAVLVVMIGEQVFLNAGPLVVRALEDAAAAGFIFNMLMVARAPVLVFQGVAISLLPHLTRLRARGGRADEFRASIGLTIRAIVAFTLATLAVLALAGPELMQIAFGDRFEYDRAGLLIVGAGMGFYLAATTLTQAALARGAAARAAVCWALAATLFLVWCLIPVIADEARRIEVGFSGAAAILALLLARVQVRAGDGGIAPGSPEEIEARLATADEAV